MNASPRFQFHLSTLLVMLLTGIPLLAANLNYTEHETKSAVFKSFGWPIPEYLAWVYHGGSYHTGDGTWILTFDIGFAVFVIAGAQFLCEKIMQTWQRKKIKS